MSVCGVTSLSLNTGYSPFSYRFRVTAISFFVSGDLINFQSVLKRVNSDRL